MRAATSLPLRIATFLFVPAVVGTLLLPAGGAGTLLTGCGPCSAHFVGASIMPPAPCLTVTATVCNLGGEVAHIDNQCNSPIALSSAFFTTEGVLGSEGGAGNNSFVIPRNSTVNLAATPNAVGAYALTLSGTILQTPIEIVIYVSDQPAEGGAPDALTSETSVPTSDASHADAHDAAKDSGKDVHDAAKDGSHDVTVDAMTTVDAPSESAATEAAPTGDTGAPADTGASDVATHHD